MTAAPPRAALWRDQGDRYGWLSILIHWATALLIFALLFIGDSIALVGDGMMRLHTSLAICGYVLLVARAVWRWRVHHPAAPAGTGRMGVGLSRALHYLLLAAILSMMATGPLMACAGRMPLRVFGWFTMPCPALPTRWFRPLHALHVLGAQILVYGVLLHVAAVFKHTVWNRDGTFGRMMTPRPGRTVAEALREDAMLREAMSPEGDAREPA